MGFTLVELMIVVAIIGVLAVVAGTAFNRYSASGRAAEAMSVIGEFKSKEEAYRAENNQYLSTDSAEGNLYPVLGTCSGQTEPCAKALPARNTWSGPPLGNWAALGFNPPRTQLYCGYVVIAGAGGSFGNAGTQGKNALGNVAPSTPWYYVRAECDNNRTNSLNTTYIATNSNTALVTLNDGF